MITEYKAHNLLLRKKYNLTFPDMFIFGFPRTSSTLLYLLLKQNNLFSFYEDKGFPIKHPSIYKYPEKYNDYLNYFYGTKKNLPTKIIVDGSVDSYQYDLFYRTLEKYNFKCKYILIIRDPIESFYSYYYTFGCKLDNQADKKNNFEKLYNNDDVVTKVINMYKFEYHIKRMMKYIDSKDIIIISYYDLVSDKQLKVVDELYNFINHPPYSHVQIVNKINTFQEVRKEVLQSNQIDKPQRLDNDIKYLQNTYEKHVQYLIQIKNMIKTTELFFENFGRIL